MQLVQRRFITYRLHVAENCTTYSSFNVTQEVDRFVSLKA